MMEQDKEDKGKDKELEKKLEQDNDTEESGKTDGDKQESENTGFFSNAWSKVKSFGSSSVKKGKKAAGFLTGSHDSVDEMSDDEFEEHLYSLDTEEDPGYSKRYRELVKELSTMPSLMAFSEKAEPEDIKEATKDSEKEAASSGVPESEKEAASSGVPESEKEAKASTEKSSADKVEVSTSMDSEKQEEKSAESDSSVDEAKESTTSKEEATDQTKAADAVEKKDDEQSKESDVAEVSETAQEEEEKTESKADKNAVKVKQVAKKLNDAKEDAVGTVEAGTGIYKSRERSKRLEKMIASKEAGSKDARALQYMKDKSDKDAKTGGFDMAKGFVDTAAKLAASFGGSKVGNIANKIAGLINKGLAFGKEKLSQRLDQKSVKNGMKNLIGGSDAYKKLKQKYKLKAPDMRRAIRTAAKASSGKSLVDADKDKLVEDYSKNGEQDGEMAVMAGGLKSSKLSDAMGAGNDEKEQTKEDATKELKNVATESKDALIELIGKKEA